MDMAWKQCVAKIKTAEGHMVRCQIHTVNDGCHEGDHQVDGYIWRGRHGLPLSFRIAGLWLTTGGRVVKPSGGEACVEGHDIMLMSSEELQNGIRLEEFERRFDEAVRKQRRRA
jgi:hypothetical protein